MATEKQISYALALLGQAGYGTRFMNAQFSKIGATMKQRSGKVVDWLAGMTKSEISHLIDSLKAA